MDTADFLLSNGRTTGLPWLTTSNDLLVRKAVCASPSSTEGNSNNAWNVNFGDGNTNNNNKYNSNALRAVAALGEETKEGWVAAFHDCCRNKKSSSNCNGYRSANWELDLWMLVSEVYSHTYIPRPSTCFIVTRPTYREIFAADFRDRIVQHWITIRLEPLFEQRFVEQGNRSHNCRKGFGTLAAIKALEKDITEVSNGYTRDAWVAKIDVRSFFMSIDTEILWEKLRDFILERYKGEDIDTLLYLTELTVKHRPQDNCIRKSPPKLWSLLARHKSLFFNPDGIGLAIGNITSQQEANFYMSHYIEEISPEADEAGARIEQFVDDITCVSPTKDFCIRFRKDSGRILQEKLNLRLHPDKFYLQHVRKGVKFVGQVIVPGRRYISNRTVAGFADMLRQTERLCIRMRAGPVTTKALTELRHHVCSLNSYLGFMVHTSSYRVRQKIFRKECRALRGFCYTRNLAVVKVRKKYDIKEFLIRKEIEDYGMDIHSGRAGHGGDRNAPGTKGAYRQLRHRATERR